MCRLLESPLTIRQTGVDKFSIIRFDEMRKRCERCICGIRSQLVTVAVTVNRHLTVTDVIAV